jgi:hypothetical protein
MSLFSLMPFIFLLFLLPGFCFIYLSLPMSAVCYCITLSLETPWEFKFGCFRFTAGFFILKCVPYVCRIWIYSPFSLLTFRYQLVALTFMILTFLRPISMSNVFGTHPCVQKLGFAITYILVCPLQPIVKSLQCDESTMILDTGFLTM